MELTPAEEALIGVLRGDVGVDFALSVAWIGPRWTVTLTSESDGLLAGTGDTFREAFREAVGVEEGDAEVPPPPRPRLTLVAGSDHAKLEAR